ncbi:MAG: hypothetical protein ACAI25_18765, partial [Planctomycetota bacterium]
MLCASSAAKADTLELSQLGLQEIQKIEQAEAGKFGGRAIIQQHVDPNAGSRFGFVRGMVIVEHSQTGDLNFTGQGATELNNEPHKFFKFRPYNWVQRNGNNINWTDYKFEWKWVASLKHDVDTLDDLCMLMSWRIAPQGNADPVAATANGIRWFARQLDPQNQLNIGGGGGQGANNQAHEGTVTRLLLYGPLASNERNVRIVEANQKRGPIGEYGAFDAATQKPKWTAKGVRYTPMDPDWWEETPEAVIGKLVEAMARCQKANPQNKSQTLYNIPFSDQIQASARLIAQFLTSDLAHVPASTNANAERLRSFAFRARAALIGIVEGATPERVVYRRSRTVSRGGAPAPGSVLARNGEQDIDAQLRYSQPDDDLPITIFDMASAALDVLLFDNGQTRAGMMEPFEDDRGRVVGSLLRVAAGGLAFNGGVPTLLVQDAIAYKAIATVSLISEGPNGTKFRDELLDTLANPTNKMRASAARAALVR